MCQSVAGGEVGEMVCPREPDKWLLNVDTGETLRGGCGRVGCPVCGPYKARRRGMAIGFVQPERQVELTLVGETWPAVRSRVRNFVYRVRAEGYEWEWCWHCEPNPAGTGHHVHGYQRGSYVPQGVLSRIADRCGMGYRVFVQRFRVPDAGRVDYGLKLAGVDYGLKGTRGDGMATYLGANGDRLTHQSRGFFEGGVRAVEGAAMAARAAERATGGRWVLLGPLGRAGASEGADGRLGASGGLLAVR